MFQNSSTGFFGGQQIFFLQRKLCHTCACALKIWIWTSKIMPDLWLSAVFCRTKKKITPPYVYSLYSPPYCTLYSPPYCTLYTLHPTVLCILSTLLYSVYSPPYCTLYTLLGKEKRKNINFCSAALLLSLPADITLYIVLTNIISSECLILLLLGRFYPLCIVRMYGIVENESEPTFSVA